MAETNGINDLGEKIPKGAEEGFLKEEGYVAWREVCTQLAHGVFLPTNGSALGVWNGGVPPI